MNLEEDRKVSRALYSHSLEEVEDLLARYGFGYIKNATEFVFMNGGINRIEELIRKNKPETPETLQDVIDDLYKQLPYQEFWHIIRVPVDLIDRLEEINKRTCDAMELEVAKGERQAKPTDQQTCPRCGSNHVITTTVITIGEGQYSEAETDLCLKCGSAW